ncbi:MAG: T9SS type A sorting domain-containing protein [Bacteroidetes bacterium]|nr:T9SS type A sorting domain-containing protein [Bacteroidota bacterium]
MMAAAFGATAPADAQLVPCAGVVPAVMANPFSGTYWNDVVVNCDMLQVDPQGNTIKAIAYGRRAFYGSPGLPSAEAHIYCADWAGNNLTINLPTDAYKPDLAIGDTVDNNGTVAYRVAVVYQIKYNVFVDVWQLDNAGTPAFSATNVLSQFQMNTPSHYADTFHVDPHIDMWSDAVNLNPATGLPTMHQFAVVWSEDPAPYPYTLPKTDIDASELHYRVGDINSPATNWNLPLLKPSPSLGGDAYAPDVACLTDVNTGKQMMELVFIKPIPTLGDVYQTEFDFTANGGSFTPAPITAPPVATLLGNGHFSPRIEAMSQYDASSGMLKWQAVVGTGGFPAMPPSSGLVYHVLGFNSASVMDDLSGSMPMFPYDDAKSPCVAAGISPLYSSDLGNTQYTTSFHLWGGTDLYHRSIDPFTGLTDSRWWQVLDASIPDNYHWDASRSTAISNCSNSGLNLLTAWYDATNIMYKESPNSMVFKNSPTMVHTPSGRGDIEAWPNPATDVLYLNNTRAIHYSLADMTGRRLMEGNGHASARLDISSMAKGLYLLTVAPAEGNTQTLKIVKQ